MDLSPGVILFANEERNSSFVFPGFSGQLGINGWGGQVGVVTQVVSVRRRWFYFGEDTETLLVVGAVELSPTMREIPPKPHY